MIVDVHAHAVPAAFVDALERGALTVGVALDAPAADGSRAFRVGNVARPLEAPLLAVTARLAAMDAQGVDLQVLSTWVGALGDRIDGAGEPWARLFNDLLLEEAGRHPDRFRVLAQLPMRSAAEAVGELRRVLRNPLCVGVEIATEIAGADLDSAEFDPVWAEAARRRCLVLLHPDRALSNRLPRRYDLSHTVGNPAETAIAATALICGGVMERHPSLMVCLAHGGGYAPFQIGRADHAHRVDPARVGNLPSPPSDYLRRMHCDTVTHSSRTLRYSIETFGIDHVLLGSDYPFALGTRRPVEAVRELGLGSDEEALVLGENLLRIADDIVRS